MRKFLLVFSSLAIFQISQAQVAFTSSNLPIVKMYTLGNTLQTSPAIIGGITIINNTSGTNLVSNLPNDLVSMASMNVRGSSSSGFPQKSFSIELRDSTNTAVTVKKPVLGMPNESDWILYGPYTDKTFMRNVITFALGNAMGEYAPRCKFVELTIDSAYQGVYVMMEKIKRDNNRVNVSKMTSSDNAAPNVTGGYILKIDKFTGAFNGGFGTSISSFQGQGTNYYFQYDYPKSITTQQDNYIHSYVDSFEQSLVSMNWTDSLIGYRKFINVKSFINYFLSNELSNNVDGYRLSTYLYKKRSTSGDGKIHMGPLWDFNLGYGNADYCDGWRTDAWAYDQPCNQADIPFWWRRFIQDTSYANQLKCRYTFLRNTEMTNARINFMIDSMVNYVGPSATGRHYAQWPILGNYVWPNYYVGNSYAEEVDTFKSWINQRLAWMDGNMPGTAPVGCLDALFPLPLQNIEFTAQAQQQNILLQWKIDNISQLGLYEIERSRDAVHFVKIGEERVSKLNEPIFFLDKNPTIGTNYYKLKHRTEANKSDESNIVFASIDNNFQMSIYPTLVNDKLNVQFNVDQLQRATLELIDMNGKMIFTTNRQLESGNQNVQLDVSYLSSGIYYIKYRSLATQEVMIKKFTKL
jgi:hypothetical protein